MKRLLIAGILALAGSTAVLAQTWTERPYDPPVGSRWIVQIDVDSTDVQRDQTQSMQVKARSELTIDGKTDDGFRVSYTLRDIKVEGNAPAVSLIAPAFSVLRDISVRGVVDRSGKPVRVDNLQETQAAMRGVVDRTVESMGSQPQLQAMMRDMMSAMLIADGQRAAEIYFGELPLLSQGQNTGLKVGEVRQSSEQAPNPLGGAPLKSDTTLRIEEADAQTGNLRLIRTRSLDPEAVKEFGLSLLRRMGVAGDMPIPPQMVEIMKTVTLTMDNRAEIEVEGGMTRVLRERTSSNVNAAGQRLIKNERKTVTVSPAP